MREHGEREGRSGELTRGSPGCGAVGKRSLVTAERLKCWWPVLGRSGEIEGRRRRGYGVGRAEGLVALLWGREEYGGGGIPAKKRSPLMAAMMPAFRAR
jgi:hypothetical protein